MTWEKAYDVAVEMHKREHDRWKENAFVLLAALASAIFTYKNANSQLQNLIAISVATIASVVFVLLALTIRGSTDSWRETIRDLEILTNLDIRMTSKEALGLAPFDLFDRHLKLYKHKHKYWQDLKKIICFRREGWCQEVFFSVTRLYTLIGCIFSLFFGAWFAFDVGILLATAAVRSYLSFPLLCR